MHFINGGRPTLGHDEIESKILLRFIWYYQDGLRFGFWAAIEKSTGRLYFFAALPPASKGPALTSRSHNKPRKSAWGRAMPRKARAP